MVKIYSSLAALFVASTFTATAVAADEAKKLDISGLIEVEVGFNDPDNAKSTSDVTLATVELGLDHAPNDKVEGHILFLFEEGENNDNIAVDEAFVTFHANQNIDVTAGRMYVPFGRFESQMVSDPLTLEVAETQEEALQMGFSSGNISGSVYAFKDDNDGDARIDDFGMNIDYETDAFSAGLSYISDVNDKSTAADEAEGIGIHALGKFGQTTVIAEHIEVDSLAGGVEPSATNFEVGYDLGGDRTIALSVQNTDEAASLNLPEDAIGIAYSMPIYDNTSFAAEYMQQEGYDKVDTDVVTLQVAYEF